jgi:hypothetical protein
MENNDREVERILEESICSYADGEPLAGLEERVLARVRIRENSPRSVTGRWAVLALAAALVVAASLYFEIRPAGTRPVNVVLEAKPTPSEATPRPAEAVTSSKRRRHSDRAAAPPKRGTFPTSSPVTAEERRLLTMLKQDPEGTAQAFDSLRKRGSEPLEVAPLVIPPLDTGGGQ